MNKLCASCKMVKPVTEFYKCPRLKDGYRTSCKDCTRKQNRESYQRNKDKVLARSREYYHANKDRYSEWRRHNREANWERELERLRNWRWKNIAKLRQYWREEAAYKKAKKLERTPKWANRERIKEIYALRDWLNLATHGFTGAGKYQSWHVDHIVPLCGGNVSGLHVENNLRVIPAFVNIKKSNSWYGESSETNMPDSFRRR